MPVGGDDQSLLSWLESHELSSRLQATSLSDLDSMVTAKEVAANVEQLLVLEQDVDAADRIWGGSDDISVAERAVG